MQAITDMLTLIYDRFTSTKQVSGTLTAIFGCELPSTGAQSSMRVDGTACALVVWHRQEEELSLALKMRRVERRDSCSPAFSFCMT